jgi:sulfur-carrier protein adenylyltransferase/sulfurtransferase
MENGATSGDSHRDAEPHDTARELPEIYPHELAQLIARHESPLIVDVREPHEHAFARIEGSRLIPLPTLHRAIDTLPRDGNIVVYCHHGIRSAHAIEMLRAAGVPARNLSGGIDRWSAEVDPSVRRY